ncbi:MAG: transposase [Actinomycetota bacterium]
MVASFRSLDGKPYTYLWAGALTQKVREGGRSVNAVRAIAIAVDSGGGRGVRGVDLPASEDGSGRTAFLRGLFSRWLLGASLIINSKPPGSRRASPPACRA